MIFSNSLKLLLLPATRHSKSKPKSFNIFAVRNIKSLPFSVEALLIVTMRIFLRGVNFQLSSVCNTSGRMASSQ